MVISCYLKFSTYIQSHVCNNIFYHLYNLANSEKYSNLFFQKIFSSIYLKFSVYQWNLLVVLHLNKFSLFVS